MQDKLCKALRLYVITEPRLVDVIKGVELALAGGATAIQLRMKNVSTKIMIEYALQLRKMTEEYNAMFVVNDRVDVAMASKADGVHLGKSDMPIKIARELWSGGIIGATVRSPEDAITAERVGANYAGAGSVFPTKTKKDTKIIGVEALRKIVKTTKLPVVAVGGINIKNIEPVLEAGVCGVAVSSAIIGAENIKKATKQILNVIESFYSS